MLFKTLVQDLASQLSMGPAELSQAKSPYSMEKKSQIRNSYCVQGVPPILTTWSVRVGWVSCGGGGGEVTTGGQAGTESQGHHLTLGGLGFV